MFPILNEEMKGLAPEVYFGGEDVPAYLHITADTSDSREELIAAIRSIGSGSNSSGYIDGGGIHFHMPDDEMIRVDLSKNFVFVSQPSVADAAFPSAWQVFRFLQEPVSRALFIGLDQAILVEKTDYTLDLCCRLDKLWAQERCLQMIIEMVESEIAREEGLANLMKTYEEETRGASSEMWHFWGTFSRLLMKRELGLRVETISSKRMNTQC